MNKVVSISLAAKALGVSTSTLRRWEARSQLVPLRTEELVADVLEIITVFSARLYGSRGHRNQKLIDGMEHAIKETQCS
ncbi:MAG TPA: hypothetical protein DDZ22_06585 [Massilia sp.]|nr:hypothetical protein [Massilia sp.]